MSNGRPATPTQWATDTNFPGASTLLAPWQGQPLKVFPATPYYVPGTAQPPAAESLNFMFWQTSTDVAALSAQAGTPDGANWPTAMQSWTTATAAIGTFVSLLSAPVYNPGAALWYVWANATISSVSTYSLLQSPDGLTWVKALDPNSSVPITSPDGSFEAVGVMNPRTSDGAFATVTGNGSDLIFTVLYPASGNASVISVYTPGELPQISLAWASGAAFANGWTFWSGGQGAHAPFYLTGDGQPVTLVTSWSPPSGFVINNYAYIVAPTKIILFPSGSTVVSAYMVTTDGQSWAQVAMPTLVSGEAVIDATYDAVNGLYYMLTGTSTKCRVWQSTTATASSWVVVSPTVGSSSGFIGHTGYALKANGTELMAIIHYAGGYYRGIISTNAAASWSFIPLADLTVPSSYYSLASNGYQFVYTNGLEFKPSGCAASALPLLAF